MALRIAEKPFSGLPTGWRPTGKSMAGGGCRIIELQLLSCSRLAKSEELPAKGPHQLRFLVPVCVRGKAVAKANFHQGSCCSTCSAPTSQEQCQEEAALFSAPGWLHSKLPSRTRQGSHFSPKVMHSSVFSPFLVPQTCHGAYTVSAASVLLR